MRKYREAPAKERFLSPAEASRLVAALRDEGNRVAAGCLLLLPTTKAGRPRTVLLNAMALEVVAGMEAHWVETNPHVFPGPGGAGHVRDLRKAFWRALDAAGIERMRVHDLRHSFASLAVGSAADGGGGASLYEVQKLLGHASSAMTQRYAHLADGSLRRATEGVARSIGGRG